jgi:hypothetical protein
MYKENTSGRSVQKEVLEDNIQVGRTIKYRTVSEGPMHCERVRQVVDH